MFHEHASRSLLKSATWFTLAFAITFVSLSLINQDWKTGLLESIIVQALKSIVYFVHERLWNKSNYGQKLKKPSIVMK
ncbi:hypothetical protein C0580_01395 [Candidatus Parcubacteria bacterium]|nr:MAG: hypothetical protein C0580_01395 [Candidatus Parcubacteria bacterium]